MTAKRMTAVLLALCLLIPLAPAAAGEADAAGNMHMIADNFLAHLLPMEDIYAYSVSLKPEGTENKTPGILIDEGKNTVSLIGEVNSITFMLSDASGLDPVAGWVVYNIRLYETDGWNACRISRKDRNGQITDASEEYPVYVQSYLSVYGVNPSCSLTPRNDRWTHLYEGTVNMLIAWEMLYGSISHFGYMESTKIPQGITYLWDGEKHYLLIVDGEKTFGLVLDSDESTLAVGLELLCALHANIRPEELPYYYMAPDPENPDNMYATELSADLRESILSAVVSAVSFESGTMEIRVNEGSQYRQ